MNKEDINNLKEMLVDFNEYSTDYTKTRCKELEKTVENTLNEIDRLNNIINKLEEYCWELKAMGCREGALDMLNKIEELKNGDKNE